MGDTEMIVVDFDGVRERGPAHRLSDGVYRLAWTPWAAGLADVAVNIGDVIETAPAEHGYRRFTRVVERSGDSHEGWLVGPAFLSSRFFAEFASALEAAGGGWEVPINGWLLTHIPVGCPFDVGVNWSASWCRLEWLGSWSPESPSTRPQPEATARNAPQVTAPNHQMEPTRSTRSRVSPRAAHFER